MFTARYLLPIAVLLVLYSVVSEGGDAAKKRPLDLPVDHARPSNDDEEDGAEVVVFFGQEFEGDAFFWCMDRSGSMLGEKIEILRAEVRAAVGQLSSQAEFGLVSFPREGSALSLSPRPIKATQSGKSMANEFLDELLAELAPDQNPAAGGFLSGAERVCGLVELCSLRKRRIILVGDGEVGEDFQQLLVTIDGYNKFRTPIDCVLVTFQSTSTCGEQFFSALSARYGGMFRKTDN